VDGGEGEGDGTQGDFIDPHWRVRDTLEQIDVARLVIEQYPEAFQLVVDANAAKDAMRDGKIASFIGIEGYVLVLPLFIIQRERTYAHAFVQRTPTRKLFSRSSTIPRSRSTLRNTDPHLPQRIRRLRRISYPSATTTSRLEPVGEGTDKGDEPSGDGGGSQPYK
jgi:Membrane dipeptidase (Peptidase family M19)